MRHMNSRFTYLFTYGRTDTTSKAAYVGRPYNDRWIVYIISWWSREPVSRRL